MEPKPKNTGFGVDVQVRRQILPKQDRYPSGVPENDGQVGDSSGMNPGNQNFRRPIPRGTLGSTEGADVQLPGRQYVDTVEFYKTEDKDPSLHGAMEANRSGDRGVAFNPYGNFQPRSMAMPRARQDDGYLGNPATMSADPLMTDGNSETMLTSMDVHRKGLYGDNRDGVLHNDPAHPGFAAVQSKIAKNSGVSQKAAGAILASSTRNASKAAKKANPRLNKVK